MAVQAGPPLEIAGHPHYTTSSDSGWDWVASMLLATAVPVACKAFLPREVPGW